MRLETQELKSGIVDVYGAIYEDHYSFHERAMAPAMATVQEDLARLDVSAEALAAMTIFNVGTGREAVAFHTLGARKVFHADLSPHAVRALLALPAANPACGRIKSVQIDLCEPGLLIAEGAPIDLAYLNGVVHHLYDGAAAFENLLPSIAAGGTVFLRIYRSGSFLFFAVDLLRRIVRPQDRAAFPAAEQWAALSGDTHPWLYSDLYDDLFVPVLALLRPKELDAYMASWGFAPVIADEPIPDCDHGPGNPPFVSITYRPVRGRTGGRGDGVFPPPIDQLRDMARLDARVAQTVALAKAALPALVRLNTSARLTLAVSVYRLAHEAGLSARQRHRALRDLLREAA